MPALGCLTVLFLFLEKNDSYQVTPLLSVSCYMHLDEILTNALLYFCTCKISIAAHITLGFHYLFTRASSPLFSELLEGKH